VEPRYTTATSTAQAPTTPIRNLPPVPPFPNSSATSTSHVPDSLPPSQNAPSDSFTELPALLVQLLNGITHTLRTAFSDKPPHTVQRLAELILNPTKHYKTLPAWLRAVDRVVSVSSTADIFPLSDPPSLLNGVGSDSGGGGRGGGILWNNGDTRNGYDGNALGSDESLGGALLTPIPWLQNGGTDTVDSSQDSGELDSGSTDDILDEPIELPSTVNGEPFLPQREYHAVTQEEFIRMELEASGVVSVSQTVQNTGPGRTTAGAEGDPDIDEEGELVPHARGPDVIGTVDMGRVDGRDIQVHIGSPPSQDGASADGNGNHAQGLLPGSVKEVIGDGGDDDDDTPAADAPSSDTDGFEFIGRDVEGEAEENADEMQVDEMESPKNDDSDVVLVDVEGKMEDETQEKADTTGDSVGPDVANARL